MTTETSIAIHSGGGPGKRTLRPLLGVGWVLLGIASRGLTRVKQLWMRLPQGLRDAVHVALDTTGVPYVLNYVAEYGSTHRLDYFAGNLVALNAVYVKSSGDERDKLARQFKGILYGLVMRNGVRRSTHPMRQNRILTKVLSDPRCRISPDAIKVLEVPCSTGVAALDNVAMLSGEYRIRTYVLGDLFFELHYDTERGCIFDEEFNLLQVKLKDRFFSIYRPERSGRRYTYLSTVLLLPLELLSWYFRRRYVYSERRPTVPVLLLHPDIQAKVSAGELTVKQMDVFKDIGDKYDLILCFNLLLHSYFSHDQITQGVANLENALNEQGLLIMGDQASFSVTRKIKGKLVPVRQEGRF